MFEKDSDRRAWARDQMGKANTPEQHRVFIEQLLSVYWSKALTGQASEIVLSTFTDLAQGHALVAEPVEDTSVWVQAKPGFLTVGDTVRVKSDAYSGDAGLAHNGRPAVITAIRSGDIHVRYTDDKPSITGFIRHSPYKLEKRIR